MLFVLLSLFSLFLFVFSVFVKSISLLDLFDCEDELSLSITLYLHVFDKPSNVFLWMKNRKRNEKAKYRSTELGNPDFSEYYFKKIYSYFRHPESN